MTAPVAVSAAHAGVLAVIHLAAFPPGAAWNRAAFAALLASPAVFGAIDERGGMGLARVAADEAEILTLATAPAARRRGIARSLLAALTAEAARRGAAVLFLEVAEDNLAAQALYAAAGFAAVGRRRGYYPDGGDALLLRAPVRP